ncbi:MAG: aspartate dehydrogenase [Candidatus Omnitrophota bacterium]
MMKRLKIGIVGCGAIGSSLAKAIASDFKKEAELSAFYDIDTKKSRDLSRTVSNKRDLVVRGLKQLIDRSELVIEASSAKSSWGITKNVLTRRRDIMVMSVGGVAGHFRELSGLAKRYGCRVYIPSGAIAGIDGIKAAGIGKIRRVTLTTRKNPKSFKGVEYIKKKGINLDKIKKDTTLFSGSAKEAVKCFPQNINVAGLLSIAGVGEDKTKVRIIASPDTKKNIHEVRIESEGAKIFTRTENILHPDNPKTSYLAVLSAVAVLKQILGPVKVGT